MFKRILLQTLLALVVIILSVNFSDVSAQVNFFDSGILVLSDSTTDVTTADIWVRRIHCNNVTSSAATLTIEDGDNVDYFTAVSVAGNSVLVANYGEVGVKFNDGLSWVSGTASAINCQVEGRQN